MVQDSRSASYPRAAIASSYDFGSIDFLHKHNLKRLNGEAFGAVREIGQLSSSQIARIGILPGEDTRRNR